MDFRVWNREELAAGQRNPKNRRPCQPEASNAAQGNPQGLRRAPSEASAQDHHDDPASNGACHSRQEMQNKADDQTPQRRSDHQTLCQRHPLVSLPQRHPRHQVSNRRQRQQFQRQQQQAGHNQRIRRHSLGLGARFTPTSAPTSPTKTS